MAVTIDVSDPASVAAAGQAALDAFGALHIAVNNAGVAMHGTPVEKVTLEEWDWVIGVNVKGVINGIRTFVPMIRSHGRAATSSTPARSPACSCAKAATRAPTR